MDPMAGSSLPPVPVGSSSHHNLTPVPSTLMDLFKGTPVLSTLVTAYEWLLDSGDDRVQDWFLVRSPFPVLAICATYMYVVKVIGPAFMKNRDPYNIRAAMVAYNMAMVVWSSWLFYNLGRYGWFGSYNYRCQPVDYTPKGMGMAEAAYFYYITKFLEFADTLFFVARKKFGHISTLHVIHHGIMPMSVWWGMKYAPGGHSTFFGFINSFVHIPMYLYYGLSALGPHMNKYLFWKKYMTTLQMIQFIAIFVHSFQLLFRSCDYPIGFVYWIGSHAILFWFLFWDFFKKTYTPPPRKDTSCLPSCPNGGSGDAHLPAGKGDVTKCTNGHTTNGSSNGVRHRPQFACSPTDDLLHLMNSEH